MESTLKAWIVTVALYSTVAPFLFLVLAPYFKIFNTSYRSWFLILLGTAVVSYLIPLLCWATGLSTFPFRILNGSPYIKIIGDAINVVVICFVFHHLLNRFYEASWKQSLLLFISSSVILFAVVFGVIYGLPSP